MSLFIRYSFYYLDIIFRSIKNPILYLSRYNLERDNSYFFDLFTFLFYELKEFTSLNTDKSIICFLYLPLNEIFLFIIGIGIVSIGYKFKLRIDLIIIVLAVFIYLVKSIISILFSDELEIYSTLFFFLFGYGELMLNPIFNLPSFLICMYFGLVNYTIQIGANNLSHQSNYKRIELNELIYIKEKEEDIRTTRNTKFDIKKINNKDNIMDNKFNASGRTLSLINIKNNTKTMNSDFIKYNKEKINKDYLKRIETEFERPMPFISSNISFENDEIILKMPFLKSTIKFANFHRKYENGIVLKFLIFFLIFLFLFFNTIVYLIIYLNIDININSKD